MKLCSKCKLEKPLEEFYPDKRSSTKRASYCIACAKEHSKYWYRTSEKYRQIVRDSGLKLRFGISSDDYFQMLNDQNGCCAVCKRKFDKYLHVDHNHETKEIRGLLCKNCNHGLGNFEDNKEFLLNAINYLDRKIVSK